jgi:alkylation response protein AidB-like acyl-CoA dehydrogenase
MKTPAKDPSDTSYNPSANPGTSGAILNAKGKNREELEALEVAEDAREAQWQKPSFVADLFMGKVRTHSMNPWPVQSEADRKIGDELIQRVEQFLRAHHDAEAVDATGEIPEKVMKGMAELGLFGMKIPKEYGGLGLSQVNYSRVLARVCAHCASTAALLSAHQSIGVPMPLKLFGTKEQKQKWLPRIAQGEVSAFGLTEPEVGSDPAKMSTTATPVDDGKSFILNGTKLWCTNGAIADLLVVMAQTPSKFVNGREKKQITAFVVEKGMPGFEVLHRCRFMGLNGIQNALLNFKDVKVPRENILWAEGKGLKLALVTLNAGRLSIPATTLGSGRDMLSHSLQWGLTRSQWGNAIGRHEAGSTKISDMASHLHAMEAMTALGNAWVDDDSHDIRLEAAMAKLFCSEHSWRLADSFMQLRGGRGYEKFSSLKARGEPNPVPAERFLRDARINRIVEGTTEILSLYIAREALDHHLKVAGDVLNPKLPLTRRASAAIGAAVFYSRWYPGIVLRQAIHRTRGLFSTGLNRSDAWAQATAARLARGLFHQMLLSGPKLEKKQNQLMRFVWIATDLFAILASNGWARTLEKNPLAQTFAATGELPDPQFDRRAAALHFAKMARLRIEDQFRGLSNNADATSAALFKSLAPKK